MSAAVFPVQLTLSSRRWCAWMGGLWGEPHLLLSPPLHHHHCMHTSSWEIVSSAYCQGVLGHRPVGHLTWWESGSPAPKIRPPSSYTWEGKQDLRMAVQLILFCPFPYCFCYLCPTPTSPSSLSSAQAINIVNWLTQSLVHWLWSLIKGLLIGTLFNTGPCRESCPLILSRQQPFPVCQCLNVINYVGRLSRYFVTCVYAASV